jgi:putative methionine-R-sulfoxide reductase with GAF domain
MDRYSIFDQSAPQNSPAPRPANTDKLTHAAIPDVQWDLEAALQLLANRARYITGAGSAIIAVGEGNALVCKAGSGATAPPAGTQLPIDEGLTSELMAECVTTRLPVKCDDTENDNRVSSDACREQSIGSVLVAPLIDKNDVVGIFQLTAERKSAFEERDVASLQRLADAVRTALEQTQSENAGTTPNGVADTDTNQQDSTAAPGKLSSMALRSGRIPLPQPKESESAKEDAIRLAGGQNLRRCKGCGFPVSAGRTICLDCEAAEIAHGRFPEESSPFLSAFTGPGTKKNWFDEHFYTIGIVLVSVLTLIVLLLWAR